MPASEERGKAEKGADPVGPPGSGYPWVGSAGGFFERSDI